jgi:hypothetical protein
LGSSNGGNEIALGAGQNRDLATQLVVPPIVPPAAGNGVGSAADHLSPSIVSPPISGAGIGLGAAGQGETEIGIGQGVGNQDPSIGLGLEAGDGLGVGAGSVGGDIGSDEIGNVGGGTDPLNGGLGVQTSNQDGATPTMNSNLGLSDSDLLLLQSDSTLNEPLQGDSTQLTDNSRSQSGQQLDRISSPGTASPTLNPAGELESITDLPVDAISQEEARLEAESDELQYSDWS